ncbi:MAG: hypothetical protein EOP70_11030 [Variovorax sp.]|jgi:hypothetical protein|nr:MAG: hypothetical protein EOP70_11030 [Variovorax sp.]
MANDPSVIGSGDGTRPVTDGTANNIGAGEKFSTRRSADGSELSGGPAPKEKMGDSRRDVEGTAHDDAAAFDLTEDLRPDTNQETARAPEDSGKH